MTSRRRAILAGVLAAAVAAPATAFGASYVTDLPAWMQRMMDNAPPEMERMMRSPEMERTMRSPAMRRMMEDPAEMDEMMGSLEMHRMGEAPR